MTTAFAISQTRDNAIPANRTGISKAALWTGRILSGLAAAFCLMDGTMKLFKPKFVVDATVQMGYPESTIVGIGLALLVCTALYLIPRTSILGAILLTGYLGGAVASQIRVEAGLFNVVFPIIFGSLAWGGLWLRDARLRQLVPTQRAHKFL
jgi:hypothetical protein